MSETPELLPCPFCGGAHNRVPQKSDLPLTGPGWWQLIWCEHCQAEGPLGETEEDAIEAWNRRPPLIASAPDMLEALQACEAILPRYRLAGATPSHDEELDHVLERVRYAIAKATGEPS